MSPLKVCVVGGGNWGTAVGRNICSSVSKFHQEFDQTVNVWVREEQIQTSSGIRNLSDIINQDHENVQYLKGKKLPVNFVAIPNIVTAVKDVDILIFTVPHQFITKTCQDIKGHIKPGAFAVSLIKGVLTGPDGGARLISEEIKEILNIEVDVLMGANIAHEVADDKFCDSTVGTKDHHRGDVLKKLFQTDNFRITVVKDVCTVEVCGALKNIVACAAGFSDGLEYGDNTKAAIIHLGLKEIVKFIQTFWPGAQLKTFFESCGVADLVTTCYGGRNRKCCETFVKTTKSMTEVEKEELHGQKLQGPETAAQAFIMIKAKNLEEKFPLFVAVHKICVREMLPQKLVDCLRQHPEYN